mgnify:CR=1 FL=1
MSAENLELRVEDVDFVETSSGSVIDILVMDALKDSRKPRTKDMNLKMH